MSKACPTSTRRAEPRLEEPSALERPRNADNALEQPTDDESDRAAPVDVGVGDVSDPAQRAERGSREVEAPRRGAPPGMAPLTE